MTLLINPLTAKTLERVFEDPPHALLLSGPRGIGLMGIAQHFASTSTEAIVRPANTKGQPDAQGTIAVEVIRSLYEKTRSKQVHKRIIIIDDAERMSHGAQSAFLKLLEEPTPHTHFILTSHAPQLLLPTIRSRIQELTLQPITKEQSVKYLASTGIKDKARLTQLLYIANGLPAELVRLTQSEEYFKARAETFSDARDFLTTSHYNKLRIVQKYRTERDRAIELVDSILAILRSSISNRPQPALITQLNEFLAVRELLITNHSIPLQLTRLAVV